MITSPFCFFQRLRTRVNTRMSLVNKGTNKFGRLYIIYQIFFFLRSGGGYTSHMFISQWDTSLVIHHIYAWLRIGFEVWVEGWMSCLGCINCIHCVRIGSSSIGCGEFVILAVVYRL